MTKSLKKTLHLVAGALAGALLACGGTAPGTGTGTTSSPENLPGKAAIRFLGTNTAGFASALLAVESLEVTVNGAAVPVAKGVTALELTQPNQAWLLGTFDLPSSGTIHAKVKLAADGSYGYGGASGKVDARGLAFELTGSVEEFGKEHHGVFVLDVGKSLLDACPGTKMLVPQVKIAF
jgi:hypothetical protein